MSLAEEALAHAQVHWNIVTKGEEFLELPLQQLVTLLSSEELKVDNEAQVGFLINSLLCNYIYMRERERHLYTFRYIWFQNCVCRNNV